MLEAHHILHVSGVRVNKVYKPNKFLEWYDLGNEPVSILDLPAGKCYLNIVKYSISIKPTLQSAYIIHIIGETAAFREPAFNPLNPELNPICCLLALLGAHHFLHVSMIRVKLLTLRLLMSYIYIYIYIYMEHLFLMFLDHTQRRSTVGRTPLDE